MKAVITISGTNYSTDFGEPHDISLAYRHNGPLRAWYIGPVNIEPVKMGDWTGEVQAGASVNFRNITFNPHAHGTHTESSWHITAEPHPVNNLLKKYFFPALVISVQPEKNGDDLIIRKEQIRISAMTFQENGFRPEALIIRTLPNETEKQVKNYSSSNPPYLEEDAVNYILSLGVEHLLIDLPSVDREEDGGRLTAHHAFWQTANNRKTGRTITEFIFVPDNVADGMWLLELQLAPFVSDAAPSRPVLYPLHKSDKA